MAADLLEFTQSNMAFSPFLLANAPVTDPGFPDCLAYDEGGGALESLSPPAVGGAGGFTASSDFAGSDVKCDRETKRMKTESGHRIGFRMKSEVEILDDGFKWRKYGKKSVKNSPNPRNYYRCSSEGCGVKKRVERDREDPRYVITTYEGVHNHPSPGTVCCSFAAQHHHHHHHPADPSAWLGFGGGQMPLMPPNPWSSVQSANFSC